MVRSRALAGIGRDRTWPRDPGDPRIWRADFAAGEDRITAAAYGYRERLRGPAGGIVWGSTGRPRGEPTPRQLFLAFRGDVRDDAA